jgi:hypothetical protein
MTADSIRTSTVSDLKKLSRAFDAACHELGIGLSGFDVPKRGQLVRCAMRLAQENDPRPSEDAWSSQPFLILSTRIVPASSNVAPFATMIGMSCTNTP